MATFRFNKIKNDIPEGIVKWEPDEEAMSYGMDLSVEDRAKTDAADALSLLRDKGIV